MRVAGEDVTWGRRTLLLGITNTTPDSFSGDGLAGDVARVVEQGRAMVAAGADWLDVGGESTRPAAEPVSRDEEIDRVCPAIEALAAALPGVPLAVDTRWAPVAAAALRAGAHLVNDVSGLFNDPAMVGLVAAAGVPVIIQHSRGTPQTMGDLANYEDVVEEVIGELEQRLSLAAKAGVARGQCLVDPGIGFAKTTEHNVRLLRRLGELRRLGLPVVVGASRKRFLGELLDGAPPDDRLEADAAVVALSIAGGADVLRVHDVRAMARVRRVADAIVRGGWSPEE